MHPVRSYIVHGLHTRPDVRDVPGKIISNNSTAIIPIKIWHQDNYSNNSHAYNYMHVLLYLENCM